MLHESRASFWNLVQSLFVFGTLQCSILKKKSRFAWFYHLMYRWAGQVVNIPGDSDLGLS